MHNCDIKFNSDNFKNFIELCEPEVKISKIISNYQNIVEKAVRSKSKKHCRFFLTDCLIYNLMFITNCPKNVLLSLMLTDISEYINTSNKIISEAYIIRLGEYKHAIISKQAYKTIYEIWRIINGWDTFVALLNNYFSSNFHARFCRHYKHYLMILTKYRKYQIGK